MLFFAVDCLFLASGFRLNPRARCYQDEPFPRACSQTKHPKKTNTFLGGSNRNKLFVYISLSCAVSHAHTYIHAHTSICPCAVFHTHTQTHAQTHTYTHAHLLSLLQMHPMHNFIGPKFIRTYTLYLSFSQPISQLKIIHRP